MYHLLRARIAFTKHVTIIEKHSFKRNYTYKTKERYSPKIPKEYLHLYQRRCGGGL